MTGFSHDGAYLGADVSAAVQKSVGNMDYVARFGAQTATDGHQVYGGFEITGKVSEDKRFGIYGSVAVAIAEAQGWEIFLEIPLLVELLSASKN